MTQYYIDLDGRRKYIIAHHYSHGHYTIKHDTTTNCYTGPVSTEPDTTGYTGAYGRQAHITT